MYLMYLFFFCLFSISFFLLSYLFFFFLFVFVFLFVSKPNLQTFGLVYFILLPGSLRTFKSRHQIPDVLDLWSILRAYDEGYRFIFQQHQIFGCNTQMFILCFIKIFIYLHLPWTLDLSICILSIKYFRNIPLTFVHSSTFYVLLVE